MADHYELKNEATKIMESWWPGITKAYGENNSRRSDQWKRDFQRAMTCIQADLIRLYLPVMDPERVPWAEKTLLDLDLRIALAG